MNTHTIGLVDFQPQQPASVALSALKKAAQTMVSAKKNAILWFDEINRRQLYKELNYSSIILYAQEELGFSKSKAYEFLNVSNRLDGLPKIKDKMQSGELGLANTVTIINVSDRENEEQWLAEALKTPNRKLKAKVKKAKEKAAADKAGQSDLGFVEKADQKPLPTVVVPVQERVQFTPTQYARYEAMWEKIRKQGGVPAGKAEALLEIMAGYLESTGQTEENSRRLENARLEKVPATTTTPPAQIHIHQCPDCQQATVQTSQGEMPISAAELEQAQCDCQISQPGERNQSPITPRTRREVLARDRHRCQRPGCDRTRFLELHHIVPRSRGGGNEADNLVTLCSACHRLVHEKGTGVAGQLMVKEAPAGYRFERGGLGKYFWEIQGRVS